MFVEVNGIVEIKELNSAEVQYTTKRIDITTFGKAYNISEEVFNNSANFTKYDDGWRIE